ncbi:MAG TPA: hypothetical protein PLH80_06170 [Spirochaetota bacterium]|nr:hypothetical protein [Spirochaetota bacterium]HOM87172.1 hypothetical protein [Spirochaetota bacterium]HOR94818.1 hypothetical protein [Spirochaetota bacterium]HPD04578.1 hypothetical protein [Spirochaetota bacterium]HPK44247.1 hypothetical protein [Spirochaetota bacterium]
MRNSTLALVFMLCFFIGCATIFSSKNKTISIISKPEGADVSVYSSQGNKIYEDKTPCSITMKKEQLLDAKVVIKKPGYKPGEVNLGRSIESWGLANACCLIPGIIIGGGIDLFTGYLLKPEITEINIILEKEDNKTESKQGNNNTHYEKIEYRISILNDHDTVNIDINEM